MVGGGPAGLAAAEHIAKQDLSVVVFEEHDTIGEPLACGEVMSVDKLRELELVNAEDPIESSPFVRRRISLQRFFFGSNSVCTARLNTVLIDRSQFDQILAKNAEAAGAEIRTGSSVSTLNFTPESVEVEYQTKDTLNTQKMKAKIVIACDGPASRLVRQVFPDIEPRFVQGVQYQIKGVFTDALEFYFDHELTPWGYGWVLPKDDMTNVGILLQPGKNPRERLNQFVKKVYGNAGQAHAKVTKEIVRIIPATGPLEQTVADRFLVAGDAGGFTNTIFYGGIAIAIHTGRLAGEAAVHAINAESVTVETLRIYEERWRQMSYADPALQLCHQVFYHELNNDDIENIGILLDNLDIENIGIGTTIRIGWRLLRNRISRSKIKLYKQTTDGFGVCRDWGF